MRFLEPILKHFGAKASAEDIDQAAIDAAAAVILPGAKPATRNRQVYTPIAAILRHNGLRLDLRRPRGAQGERRTLWLTPKQFEALANAAGAIRPRPSITPCAAMRMGRSPANDRPHPRTDSPAGSRYRAEVTSPTGSVHFRVVSDLQDQF